MSANPGKIRRLMDLGFFGSLDVQMAGLASRAYPDADEDVLIAAALSSRAVRLGHVCAKLDDFAGRSWREVVEDELKGRDDESDPDQDEGSEAAVELEALGGIPALEDWVKKLGILAGAAESAADSRSMFVLKGSRLYLRRFWKYEAIVEARLTELNAPTGRKYDPAVPEKYFADADAEARQAVLAVLDRRLSILSGGPGTGKTHTVARVVAILAELASKDHSELRVLMAAPTGKAADRMVVSIKRAKDRLRDPEQGGVAGLDESVLAAIPEKASTIHHLLGAKHNSPYFKCDRDNPLDAGIVIVDEASMVDLPLMAKLLDALPDKCSLLLVGDENQLASVEPGRVFGDVCAAAEDDGPLAGAHTRLAHSHRFPDTSEIGLLSRLINDGKSDEAWNRVCGHTDMSHLDFFEAGSLRNEGGALDDMIRIQLKGFIDEKVNPEEMLKAAANLRILCALRKGPFGVDRMNKRVERVLSEMGLNPAGRFYDHRLIMVRVNTPSLSLYNGDIGVILKKGGGGVKEYEAWFAGRERPVPASLLPDHETAFAMTIHKSQGSEFRNVALILPGNGDSPILTRELLYTGITRVQIDEKDESNSGKLALWCSEMSFKKAVEAKTSRETGLFGNMDLRHGRHEDEKTKRHSPEEL